MKGVHRFRVPLFCTRFGFEQAELLTFGTLLDSAWLSMAQHGSAQDGSA